MRDQPDESLTSIGRRTATGTRRGPARLLLAAAVIVVVIVAVGSCGDGQERPASAPADGQEVRLLEVDREAWPTTALARPPGRQVELVVAVPDRDLEMVVSTGPSPVATPSGEREPDVRCGEVSSGARPGAAGGGCQGATSERPSVAWSDAGPGGYITWLDVPADAEVVVLSMTDALSDPHELVLWQRPVMGTSLFPLPSIQDVELNAYDDSGVLISRFRP